MEKSINKLKEQLEQVKTENNNLMKENQQKSVVINQLKDLLNKKQNLKNNLLKKNRKMNDELKKTKLLFEEEKSLKNNLLQININLNKKINELEIKLNNINNIQNTQNDSGDKLELLKLYKNITDLNAKLKRYPYDLEENEKLISVIFASVDQKTHYSLICKNTHSINYLEAELYKEYPDYWNSDYYYLCKGKIINKFQTLENNQINNGDVIILIEKE